MGVARDMGERGGGAVGQKSVGVSVTAVSKAGESEASDLGEAKERDP